MKTQIPLIEIAPDWGHGTPPIIVKEPWFRSRRFIIFIIALLISTSISLTYVFSRPAIYLSYATLLTVAKTEIDQRSKEADIQHVVIQKQILLGQELITETARRLQLLEEINSKLTVDDIRKMLNVKPIVETNLVEMEAESPDPKILPLLINTWIDVYLDARAETVRLSTGSTTHSLQQEISNLTEQIDLKRIELNQFRQTNSITSTGREENEALARLKGLNDSFNKASEEEVMAKARMEAVNKAINQGQAVVPKEDTRTLSLLEQQAQKLREQLKELDERYTREYMAKISKFKVIPEQLAALEERIAGMRQSGQSIVLTESQQQYAAAAQTVRVIRQQLNEHKNLAAEFTARFSEYEALQTDMEGMELLLRETQERLIKIETKQSEKYPQVDIVERAFLPRDPVRPDYVRDALIAIIGSILLALSSVWFAEFLTRKEEPNTAINLSGIHLYNTGTHQQQLDTNPLQQLEQQKNYALENSLAREISNQEFDILIHAANDKGKRLITLLLSGLSAEEISLLDKDTINKDNDTLNIKGTSPRSIPINSALKKLFSDNNYCMESASGQPLTTEDIASILLCSVIDAGLAGPNEINAEAIRHSYIIYLVQQGMRLSDLELIIGYISPVDLSAYSNYSPPSPGRPFKEIDLIHPALVQMESAQ